MFYLVCRRMGVNFRTAESFTDYYVFARFFGKGRGEFFIFDSYKCGNSDVVYYSSLNSAHAKRSYLIRRFGICPADLKIFEGQCDWFTSTSDLAKIHSAWEK